MPVLVHYLRTRTMNGSTRYSEQLLAALQAIGVPARAHTPFYREVEVAGRRWLGTTTLRLGSALPVIRRAVVHATQYYYNPPLKPADVVTIHDIMPVATPGLYGLTPARLRLHERQVRRALRSSRIVTPTAHSRGQLLAHFPDDARPEGIHVVPNGVDPTRFFPDPSPAGRRHPAFRPGMLNVVVVLNRERRKRLDLLLEAACGLPFVNVLHVGNPVATPEHQAAADAAQPWAQRLQREQRYQALGAVPDDVLRSLLSDCDLAVHPSMAEGFGLPPLEALACGAPVLASGIPPHREVLGDAARFVDLNAQALAGELERAWDGAGVRTTAFPSRQIRLRQAALFTWEQAARQTVAVYEQVRGKSPW